MWLKDTFHSLLRSATSPNPLVHGRGYEHMGPQFPQPAPPQPTIDLTTQFGDLNTSAMKSGTARDAGRTSSKPMWDIDLTKEH